MIDTLATALIIASLVAAIWPLVLVLLNRRAGTLLLGVLAVLELGLLVQVVAGIVNLIGTDRPVSGATFVGYLLGSLVILPVAAFWALAERSRWGAGVLVLGCLVIPVLIVRLNQIWAGQGG
jgi:hypothetical protein